MSEPYQAPESEPHMPPPMVAGEGSWEEHRNYVMFLHLSPFSTFVLSIFGYIVPVVLWQMKKDEHPVIDRQGKEVLNFHLTMFLIVLGLLLIMFVGFLLGPLVFITMIISWGGLMIVGIGQIVLMIMAAVKASNGEEYTYPFRVEFFT